MKLLENSLLVLSAVLSLTIHPAFADTGSKGHGHKTPHGGIIQEAEGIHTEFLIDKNGEPKVYLYDKDMKPFNKTDSQARLTVKGHDGVQHSRELKAFKDPKEGLMYKGDPIKGLTDWDTAVVSLKLKERWAHVRFSNHPEGKSGH